MIRQMKMRHGTEGPREDPYAWTELSCHVTNSDHAVEITLHGGGLLCWIHVKGWANTILPVRFDGEATFEAYSERDRTWVFDLWERIVGFDPEKFEKYCNRIRHTCMKCGCRWTVEESGLPGESFNICRRCGEIVSTEFYLSEIE